MNAANEGVEVTQGGNWGSPNAVPTMLAHMVKHLSYLPPNAHKDLVRQNALVSLFLGMSIVEAFANAYGTVVAENIGGDAGKALKKAANAGGPTSAKLEGLFKHGFNNAPLNKDDPRWKAYDALRELRNDFVHFKTTNETVTIAGITFNGMANLSVLEKLTAQTPAWVLKTLCGLIELVGEGQGKSKAEAAALAHLYLGILPGTL